MEIEKLVIYALKNTDCPLYDKLSNPTGIIPVIAALDQPEPRSPYLLIDKINTRKIGLPYKSISHKGGNTKEHIFQVKEYLVGLTLHATTKDISQEWIRHFENGIHSDMYSYAFTQQGASLVSSDDLMYQFEPVSGTAYKRAILNLTLRAEVEESYQVNFIDRVVIEGYLSDKYFKFFENQFNIPTILLFGENIEKLVNNDLPDGN